MISVVTSWPVQSCRVSLIGSLDSGTSALATPPRPKFASSAAPSARDVLVIVVPPSWIRQALSSAAARRSSRRSRGRAGSAADVAQIGALAQQLVLDLGVGRG